MRYAKAPTMPSCTLSAVAVATTVVLAVITVLTWGLTYSGVLDAQSAATSRAPAATNVS